MQDRVAAKGYTIVPLELYFIGGRVKVEVGPAKGKQEWDKRQALREKQDQREAERAMRRYVKQAEVEEEAIPCGVPSGFSS